MMYNGSNFCESGYEGSNSDCECHENFEENSNAVMLELICDEKKACGNGNCRLLEWASFEIGDEHFLNRMKNEGILNHDESVITINGTMAALDDVVGECTYPAHPGKLSKCLVEAYGCYEEGCSNFKNNIARSEEVEVKKEFEEAGRDSEKLLEDKLPWMKEAQGKEKEKEVLEYRLFDGTWVNEQNMIAYCHYTGHPGYISVKLEEKHECVKKQCSLLEKMNPSYWERQKAKETKKKAKKKSLKDYRKEVAKKEFFIRRIIEKQGNAYVTQIKEVTPRKWEISYIFEGNVSLSKEMKILKKALNSKVLLIPVKTSKEKRDFLLKKPKEKFEGVLAIELIPNLGSMFVKRLKSLGFHHVEDLLGENWDEIYIRDCENEELACYLSRSEGMLRECYRKKYQYAVTFANENYLRL
jgi:hypothetical protein